MAENNEKYKQMVLRHMNADHRLDLGLYLRDIKGLSAEQLAAEGEPEMMDIGLESMHIRTTTSETVYVVPFRPPMAAMSECRTRLVAMAMEARAKFGVPLPEHGEPKQHPVPYHGPKGAEALVMIGVFFYAITAAMVFTGHDEQAARVWSSCLEAVGVPPQPSSLSGGLAAALSNFLGGESGFRYIVRLIALPVLAIHVAEAWWMSRTRLAPHNMHPGSKQWLLWTSSTFWEGYPAFLRFDALVAARRTKGSSKDRQ